MKTPSDLTIDSHTATWTRVKRSGASLAAYREDWNNCGSEPMKGALKLELQRRANDRGMVIEVVKGRFSTFARIKWDEGSTSDTSFHLLEPA